VKHALHLALTLPLITNAFAAETALTAPVGYTTVNGAPVEYSAAVGMLSERLHPGLNLIGLRLHERTLSSGSILAIGTHFVEISASTGPENGDSQLPLTEGATYILEITSGAKAGVIQEIKQWEGQRLTLLDDLSAAGVKVGDQFALRKAATLNSVFDPRFTGLQKGEDPSTADTVMIPQGTSFGNGVQLWNHEVA
jgi:hypothetical protein